MTRGNAYIAGWAAIAGATALLFALDALRMVNFHFNWFVAILVAVSAVLVAFVVRLARGAGNAPPSPDISKPAETGTPDGQN